MLSSPPRSSNSDGSCCCHAIETGEILPQDNKVEVVAKRLTLKHMLVGEVPPLTGALVAPPDIPVDEFIPHPQHKHFHLFDRPLLLRMRLGSRKNLPPQPTALSVGIDGEQPEVTGAGLAVAGWAVLELTAGDELARRGVVGDEDQAIRGIDLGFKVCGGDAFVIEVGRFVGPSLVATVCCADERQKVGDVGGSSLAEREDWLEPLNHVVLM